MSEVVICDEVDSLVESQIQNLNSHNNGNNLLIIYSVGLAIFLLKMYVNLDIADVKSISTI